MAGSPPQSSARRVVARHRKARREYEVLDSWEAGLVLKGTEVKSIRAGNVAFRDAHARAESGELWLHNLHIAPYDPANRWNHDETRARKLLLRRDQIRRIVARSEEKGLALVPLDVYFRGGRAKVTLALCRGRKHRDRREELKRRTMRREAERAMRSAGRR
ncbi:MAG: SsrA-binding protein SmpB [Gemmatimonadetes bacterium]|nr:SsrA-binding protein SmpB [Gemmatimonadota bacterium]MCY3943141.1 SsrA-binding protein SmpB [Gemmatimonadota bacterium]